MGTWFKILAWITVPIAVVFGALYLVMFDVWRVPSDDPLLSASIAPTLAPGDLVVLFRRYGVDRGQLARCPDPQAPGRYVIARIMGEGGDKLVIDREFVTIDAHHTPNPRACDEPKVTVFNPNTNEDDDLECSIEDYGEMTHPTLRSDHPEPPTRVDVERGRVYLVSDDRHVHLDSRDYGQLSPGSCQHLAFRIVSAHGFGDSPHRFSVVW